MPSVFDWPLEIVEISLVYRESKELPSVGYSASSTVFAAEAAAASIEAPEGPLPCT